MNYENKPFPPEHCRECNGEGVLYPGCDDCEVCGGSGYKDKVQRVECQSCGEAVSISSARISPDHDGNRTVCDWCNFYLSVTACGNGDGYGK